MFPVVRIGTETGIWLGDDLFIIPIVDQEREVIGRSVFAFVR